jgi:acyl-homoserine lactone acylase PvdQ
MLLTPDELRQYFNFPITANRELTYARKHSTFRQNQEPITLQRMATLLSTVAVLLITLPAYGTSTPAGEFDQVAKSVTIYRDNFGVPHVYGPTDANVVFGFIYAQAEDNFPQIEENYIRALGRTSEIYGDSSVGTYAGASLGDDLLVKMLEIPRLSIAEYERASLRTRELCDAVANGRRSSY